MGQAEADCAASKAVRSRRAIDSRAVRRAVRPSE
jgi:hypothetical protein